MRFVHGQIAWMVATVLVLAVLGSLAYELFFVISLLGLLIVTELTAPISITPAWRRRLRWLILLGLLGFAYVVVRRILEIIPSGVL
ncbi:hypothetical protein SAMN05216226_11911 [Halovenus aranensis]|uniref:Uncharacterized protein n=2 Tax=Halovenus aranensis TaxID=890420 RepID=A0A1G8ZA77_9EURY|nr:hypothetical protein SAMN05216226_11911 [Halovenus aranensis]